MAYIGRQLARGENKLFDDISSSFNGSTATFNLTVSSVATATATPYQLFVSLGGVMQKPNTDFTTAGNQITFTTAPAAGLSCWIMMQGDTIDNAAIPDASVTPSKISGTNFAFSGDLRLKDADGSHYVGFASPTTVSTNKVWTLPAADGTSGQFLKTNGSAVLSWDTVDTSTLMPLAGGTFSGDVTFDGATAGYDIVWDKSDNALEWADNAKAKFGTGGDLEIFHNASNSVINDAGTGDLLLQVGGSTKATVSSTGFDITGALTVSTNATITGNLTVNGTTTTINTQTLDVEDKNVVIGKVSSPSDTTADGGGWTLKGASDKTFNWVNSTDAWTSSEHIHLGDNKRLLLGTGSDCRFFHDGSHTYLSNINNNVYIQSSNYVEIGSHDTSGSGVKTCSRFIKDGAAELWHNNVKKIETTSGGINVTGAINVNGSPLSSAPTIDLTASGAIGANKPVIVNTSGQAVEIAIPSDQTGSGVKQNSTGSSGTKCASNGAGQYIIMSADGNDIKARVATISGTTISYGTEANVASSNASYDNFDITYVKQRDCYMIVYTKSSSDLWVKCLTVSGTSITAGTESQQSSQLNTRISIANATDSASGWCCVFWFDEAQNRLWMKSLKPNTTITNAVGEGNTSYISGRSGTTNALTQYNPDQQRFYGLTYYHPSTALYCESWTCAESNGGISRSGTHTVSSSIIHDGGYGWMRWGLTYSPTIKKMLVSYPTGSGSGTGKIRTLTHVDGTWTTGSESTLGSNYDHMRMATHETTEQSWLVYTNSTASGWNNNGKGPLKIRKITVNASTEAISLGSSITLDSGEYMKNGICSGTDGMFITSVDTDDNNYPEAWFHKIGQTNMTTENFLGFSSAGYSNGQTATINVVGNTTTQSSLTTGQKYYVQGAGTVGTDPSNPVVVAGLAVSSTKLLINPGR